MPMFNLCRLLIRKTSSVFHLAVHQATMQPQLYSCSLCAFFLARTDFAYSSLSALDVYINVTSLEQYTKKRVNTYCSKVNNEPTKTSGPVWSIYVSVQRKHLNNEYCLWDSVVKREDLSKVYLYLEINLKLDLLLYIFLHGYLITLCCSILLFFGRCLVSCTYLMCGALGDQSNLTHKLSLKLWDERDIIQ